MAPSMQWEPLGHSMQAAVDAPCEAGLKVPARQGVGATLPFGQ